MQILKKLQRIFDRKTKVQLLILVIVIIIGAFLEMLAIAAVAPFISVLLDNTTIETNQYLKFIFDSFGFRSVNAFLAMLTFLLATVYIARGIYTYVLTRVKFRFVARRQMRLADRLLRKILGYPYLYHAGKNIAEMQQIVLSDSSSMFTLINSILTLLSDSFMSLFILVFLFLVSPEITLSVLVIAMIFALLYFKVFRKELVALGKRSRTAGIGMRKAVNQALGGMKEVKVLHRESFFHKRFIKNSNLFVKVSTRFRTLDALPRLLIESILFSSAFFIVGLFILAGTDITGLIPQLSMFVLAAFRLLPAVTRQINQVNSIINNRVSVDAVYKSLFEEDDSTYNVLPAETELPASVRDIIVSDITFQYPKTPSPVLVDTSLTIPYKKSVAFIGPSGAGKTTLADIILGVLNPKSGGVFFEGKSVHHNFDVWCHNVGYIPQQIYLLDESILENVAFGIERSDIDEAQVWHALEQAQLAEFVHSLHEGLETVIGDRGIRLSGGQRQRVGIARALYNNPSILVLDEATSSLDTETEKAVMEAIDKFQGEKTMIIIAHRLSTIEHCDIIYRVEDGKVVREK